MDDELTESADPGALTAAEIFGMVQAQWRVVVAITVAVLLLGLGYSLQAQNLYEADAVIQISSQAGQELRVDGVVDYDRAAQQFTYAKTQLNLLQSRELREVVIRRHQALGFAEPAADEEGLEEFEKALKVVQRKDTELFDVTVTDPDPERAARLANLVVEVYREQTLDGRRDSAREAKVWLQQQLADYKQRIVDESAALIAYQREHDLADAEEDVSRLSATMNSLNLAYGEVNTQRVLLETTIGSHERLFTQGAWEALAKDMNTPLVVALTEQYSNAATERAQIAARYLERMPERQFAESKVAGIEAELRHEVQRTLATERTQLDQLRAKEANLAAEIDDAKARLLDRQALHEEYERLKLQLDRSKEFFDTLSQRDAELDLASRTQLSNVRVVDAARAPADPVSPNIPRNLAFSLGLGLLLGIGVAYVIEYVDDSVSSPFDVANYLRVPFLGIVPHLEDAEHERDRALHVFHHPNSYAAEAIRAVRTLLEMSPGDRPLKRILVTSSDASEGKTNTAVSLAVAFASRGRRVLIIDADMRRPRLHHVFELPKDDGLSTVLKGAPIEAAVLPSGIPGIDVLTAGPKTEGPNELLGSLATERLLDALDPQFDIIIIDTPPAGMLSDAAILSRYVDGIVMVARQKRVSRWMARDVIFRLQQVGAPILGVVINDADVTGRSFKYRYYYGYKYRYDDDKTPKAAAK